MSLGTDRRAENDDVLPGGDGDKRGWWGDSFRPRRIGSRLWLLERQKITADSLLRAEEYAAEALAWLTEKKIAAAVRVRAERTRSLADVVYRNRKRRGEIRRFDYLERKSWRLNDQACRNCADGGIGHQQPPLTLPAPQKVMWHRYSAQLWAQHRTSARHLDWIAQQMLPITAAGDELDRHARTCLPCHANLQRLPADRLLCRQPAFVGDELRREDGVRYSVRA
ncbi:phage GP46 family protein [Neisseria subflava]|nr:phage GP46 family protein [Neisseria subflava]